MPVTNFSHYLLFANSWFIFVMLGSPICCLRTSDVLKVSIKILYMNRLLLYYFYFHVLISLKGIFTNRMLILRPNCTPNESITIYDSDYSQITFLIFVKRFILQTLTKVVNKLKNISLAIQLTHNTQIEAINH